MRKFHSGIRRICAGLIGLVFMVAGFLKLMDPVGTGLIVESYMKFLHVSSIPLSGGLAGTILALAETLTGMALISGVWRKAFAVVTIIFLSSFTLLTLALLIVNPDMDCGCFGESFHLTHLQSFIKNLVLVALAAIAFIPLDDGYGPRKPKYVGFVLASIAAILFMLYSRSNLPLVDFTAFAPGDEIFSPAGNEDTPDEEAAEAIVSFTDMYGEYADYLASDGPVLMFTSYDPDKLDPEEWGAVENCVYVALAAGVRPLVLVPDIASAPASLSEYLYAADRKTLLTINRSNGGATYLDDGLVTEKWPAAALPDEAALSSVASAESQELSMNIVSKGRITFESLLLGAFAVLILL